MPGRIDERRSVGGEDDVVELAHRSADDIVGISGATPTQGFQLREELSPVEDAEILDEHEIVHPDRTAYS